MVKLFKFLGFRAAVVSMHEQVAIAAGFRTHTFFNVSVSKDVVKDTVQRVKEAAKYAVDVATRRKVYFYHSGRDCDGVEYGSPVAYSNIIEARKSQEHDQDWADGPMYFTRITKAEYEKAESYTRDRFAEQMNY